MPIPIPQRPSGYKLGRADAPIILEMFFDLECPFSKKSWTKILKVAETYSDRLYLILQPMTLGNHRQSWDATKAAIAVAGDDTDKFVDFATYLFQHQGEFANEAFKDKTQTDFHRLLASYAADGFDWNERELIDRLESKEIYNQARVPARLAVVRGVWSTPTFFINGAEATDLSSQSSLEDWQQTIDSLLN
ncbi:DsbA family protein [Myxosarcina sp. GI1(2024)]